MEFLHERYEILDMTAENIGQQVKVHHVSCKKTNIKSLQRKQLADACFLTHKKECKLHNGKVCIISVKPTSEYYTVIYP
jgi:hypothetical protein